MGVRRSSTLLVTALAALAVGAVPAAQAAPPAPLNVEVGGVRCKDLSGLAESFPAFTAFLDDPSRTATVHVELRSTSDRAVPYEVTVNGETRNMGSVGPGGRVLSDVILPGSANPHVQVKSDGRVLVDRTFQTRC